MDNKILDEMQARCDAATPGPLRYTPTVEGCGHIVMPKMREDAAGAYVHWPEHEKALARLEILEAALRVLKETSENVGNELCEMFDDNRALQLGASLSVALARVAAILEASDDT